MTSANSVVLVLSGTISKLDCRIIEHGYSGTLILQNSFRDSEEYNIAATMNYDRYNLCAILTQAKNNHLKTTLLVECLGHSCRPSNVVGAMVEDPSSPLLKYKMP